MYYHWSRLVIAIHFFLFFALFDFTTYVIIRMFLSTSTLYIYSVSCGMLLLWKCIYQYSKNWLVTKRFKPNPSIANAENVYDGRDGLESDPVLELGDAHGIIEEDQLRYWRATALNMLPWLSSDAKKSMDMWNG